MPGFRPGKVPVSLLRKQYGRSVMGEVLEQAVNEGSQQAISDHQLRPALRPKIEVTSFDEGKDLEFTLALEVLPEVPPIDLKAIKLTRLVAEVDEAAIDKALDNLAQPRPGVRAARRRRGRPGRRPADDRLRGHDRRRAVRGRQGRGLSRWCSARAS